MKTDSLIKKLEKLNFKVIRTDDGFRNYVSNGKHDVQFYNQDGYAVCVRCGDVGLNDDSMTDTFYGFYAKTYKRVLEHMTQN